MLRFDPEDERAINRHLAANSIIVIQGAGGHDRILIKNTEIRKIAWIIRVGEQSISSPSLLKQSADLGTFQLISAVTANAD
jgi:hypothetical protein